MPLRPKPNTPIEARDGQSKLIEAKLNELGTTWSALADSIGLSRSYFQMVRRGRNGIKKPETIAKICRVLDLDPDDLYLAGGYLPPDVEQIIVKYPQLITAVRKAGAQYDAQQEETQP